MDSLSAITTILTVCFIALSVNVKLTSSAVFIVPLIFFALKASALPYSLDASPFLNKPLSTSTSFILGRSDDQSDGTSSLISGSLVHSVILIAVVLGIFGFFLFVMLLWNHFCPAPRRSRLREETTQDPVDIELVAAAESSSESHTIKPAAVTSESSSEEPVIPTKSSHTIKTPPAVTESSSPEPSSSSYAIDTPAAAHIPK